MKNLLFQILVLFISFSFIGTVNADAQNSVNINSGIVVSANALNIPNLTIVNSKIEVGEEQILRLEQVTFEGGEVAAGLMCRFVITLEGGDEVILESQTDSQGECEYTTSLLPSEQGFVVINGDENLLNQNPGIHSVVVLVNNGLGQDISSQPKNYEVEEVTLIIPDFEIEEEVVTSGQGINVKMKPVILSNGQILSEAPLRLTIKLPGGQEIVLSGKTRNDGSFEYSSGKTLQEQGLTLVSGNIDLLSQNPGRYEGFIEIDWKGKVFTTNFDNYEVINLPEIVRTGGLIVGSISFFGILAFIIFTFLTRRGKIKS